MTDKVSFRAARTQRERDETAPSGGRRRSRKSALTERDMAELEALLMGDLQSAASPSIAGADGEGEPPVQSSGDAVPATRPAPTARPRAAARKSVAPQPAFGKQQREAETVSGRAHDAPVRPDDLQAPSRFDEFPRVRQEFSAAGSALAARAYDLDDPAFQHRHDLWPEPRLAGRRRNDDAPLSATPRAAMPLAERRSLFTRAINFAATVASVIALLGVSALLVLLALGERPETLAVKDPARVGQAAIVSEVAPESTESESMIVTGSADVERDANRIPSQGPAVVRSGGTVAPVYAREASVQAPQPAENLSAQDSPAASATAAGEPSPGAAPAVEEPAPPAGPAVAQTGAGNAALARGDAGESAAAGETRHASVTTHVNMRAKPENDAAVVAVVPAKRNVEVVECERWCEVAYAGKQGFIHKRFVSGLKE